MSLSTRAVAATKWSSLFGLLGQAFNFLASVVLMRLLAPEDYGLFAIVLSIAGFSRMFQDVGIGASLVQREAITADHLHTAFWSMVAFGTLLYAVMACIAFPVAGFYGEPRAAGLLLFVSTGFIASSLSVVPRALLTRELDFKAVSGIAFGANVIASGLMIYLAISRFGVWSLAIGNVVPSVVSIPFLYGRARWFPRARFRFDKLRDLLAFGINISGAKLVGWGRKNADYLIVGKALGSVFLGYYTFAYKLVTEPVNRTCAMMFKLALPVFSRAQTDDERLRRGFLVSCKYLMMIAVPLSTGVLIVASEIVVTVFGEKWVPAIPLVQIMAVYGIFEVIQELCVNVLHAKGAANKVFRLALVQSFLLVVAIFASVRFGITAVAVCVMLLSGVFSVYYVSLMKARIGLRWNDVIGAVRMPALASLVMAIVVALVALQMDHLTLASPIVLGTCVGVGAVVYSVAIVILDRESVTRGLRMLLSR